MTNKRIGISRLPHEKVFVKKKEVQQRKFVSFTTNKETSLRYSITEEKRSFANGTVVIWRALRLGASAVQRAH